MRESKTISKETKGHIKKQYIAAFSYAEGGAMGDPGAVSIITQEKGKAVIYEGNTLFDNPPLKILDELIPQLRMFFEKESVDKEWGYEYTGAGNHLFIKAAIHQRLKQKYEKFLDSDIYECGLSDVVKICDNYNLTKPFTLIESERGDITKIDYVDAIVNAASRRLLGGGGVDGAIHRGAGKQLLEECKLLHGCETGEAKITKAYRLPCKYVIHTVGPIWNGGQNDEEKLLKNCYINSLNIAKKNHIRTIAFPSISTGAYRFPLEKAAKIAVSTVREYCEKNPDIFDMVTWVLFDNHTQQIYNKEISNNKIDMKSIKESPLEYMPLEELVKQANAMISACGDRKMTEEEEIEDDAEGGYFQQDGDD